LSAFVGTDKLYEALDPRTREILERRHTTSVVRRRGWLVRRSLVGADLLGLTVAFVVAELAFPTMMNRAGALSQLTEYGCFALCLPVWIGAAKMYGLYDKDEERADHSTADDFAGVFHLATICAWLLYALSLLTYWFNPQFGKIFFWWLLAVAGVPLARLAARSFCRRQIHYLQNTIIVGAGDVGQTIARKLLKHPEYGINLVGFVDSRPKDRIAGLDHLTILGEQDQLIELTGLLDVERVIFAFSNDDHEGSLDLIRKLNDHDVQVDIVPRFFEVLSARIGLHSVEGVLMCGLPRTKLSRSSHLLKRIGDLALSALVLIVLAPVFAAVAIAIKVTSSGPVFFRQVRIGEGGRKFTIWKFRTMETDAEERKHEFAHLNKHLAPGGDPRMFKIDGDPRVTQLGAFLRRWSLDELPQLINVLRGEMSLVGPRPLILEEADHVGDWAARRVDLKPGITGLWQVLGRDGIGFDEMVKLDYLYVTNWSVLTDLKLLARTAAVVFQSHEQSSVFAHDDHGAPPSEAPLRARHVIKR
jgi:exopolysaccharide biosynthesis polyprenyl glycosylphosphotransferase